jgi:hypothetical protein
MTAFRARFLRRWDLLQKRRLRQRPGGCPTGEPHHSHGRVLFSDPLTPHTVTARRGIGHDHVMGDAGRSRVLRVLRALLEIGSVAGELAGDP